VVHLIKKGETVKPGAAALLQKLKITPFSFGIDVHQVYNGGFVYGADLLEMTDRDVLDKFAVGLSNIAALGLQIGYPTLASVPHSIVKAFKNLVAVGIQTNYSFGPVDSVKVCKRQIEREKERREANVETREKKRKEKRTKERRQRVLRRGVLTHH